MPVAQLQPMYYSVDQVPTMGIFFGGTPVAASGQIVIRGVPHYAVVPYTDVATIGAYGYLYGQQGSQAVSSGMTSFETNEIRIPSHERADEGGPRAGPHQHLPHGGL
jgi:hypothetical protein